VSRSSSEDRGCNPAREGATPSRLSMPHSPMEGHRLLNDCVRFESGWVFCSSRRA